jgi:hypothetical protein
MSTKNNPETSPENKAYVSQTETITLLENTIKQLKEIVDKINNQSLVNLPNKNVIDNLVNTTNELVSSLEIKTQKSVQKTTKKPNFNLIIIGIIGIVAIASIVITNFWFTKEPQEIAEKLPIQDTERTEKLAEPNVKKEPRIIDNIPANELEVRETPPELIPPAEPTIGEISPTPEPELTPEQNLIASIQNQVAEISQKYAKGSILAIEANFGRSYLTVTIDDSWYEISENHQDKLLQDILTKAQTLDFYKLTIKDAKNNLIARSPVVGNEMIVLRR